MNRRIKKIGFQIIAAGWITLVFNPCGTALESGQQQTVVVTTSLLACAAAEVLPEDQRSRVISLIAPGACPGHFDLKPDVLPYLQQAALIIRHDFQVELENKLKRISQDSVQVSVIRLPGSLLIPDHYIKLTDQIVHVLIDCYPGLKKTILEKQETSRQKSEQVKQMIVNEKGSWKGQPVIAAVHQKQFATYLGLNVIGVLKRTEEMTPGDLTKLIHTKAAMIIGNYQSGPDAAKALGKRMQLPVAILSNFPDNADYGNDYTALIKNNIEKINQAWSQK